ncbi:MAG: hypothetical protein CML73_05600 [Rhodobiaceae bacterium]|nr:hypothetical protein [Rhodobiaceae bacterium]
MALAPKKNEINVSETISKKVKGGRKFFFDQAETDMLLSMLLSLMAEHSSVKDRLITLEAFLSDKGLLDTDELTSYTPNEDTSGAMDIERVNMIKNILEAGRNIGNKSE